MKRFILLPIICLATLRGHGQVTPFTGGSGSGFTANSTISLNCGMYTGGNADGVAMNSTPSLTCSPYSGGVGDGYDTNHGGCETLLLTKVVNQQTGNISMRLFPNPASGTVMLRMEVARPLSTQVILLRSDGLIVRSHFFRLAKGTNLFPLDLRNLENGVYFVYSSRQPDRQQLVVLNR